LFSVTRERPATETHCANSPATGYGTQRHRICNDVSSFKGEKVAER